MRKKAIAVIAALSLVMGTAPAQAEIRQDRPYSVDVHTGAAEGFQTAEVNKGRVSWLMYNSPTYGQMPNAFYVDAYAGQYKVPYGGDATKVQTSSSQDGDTVTLRHFDPGLNVELVRTFRVTPSRIEVEAQLFNRARTPQDLKLNLSNGMLSYDHTMTATAVDDGYSVSVGGRYSLNVLFDAPSSTGTGGSNSNALTGGLDARDSRFQAGTWTDTVAPGEALVAKASIGMEPGSELPDSDGDGFPDEWERHGFTANGVEFPLHRWGADPNKIDLFLQLNWMKSEWETLKCSEKRKYSPTEEDFAQFLECANANVNVYRPSRATLNDLVGIFAKQGVNLHIDAGYYYTNIRGYTDPKGGPTIDYSPYYFNGEAPGVRLLRDRDNLLGERKSVFRVGIIGDSQDEGIHSSGNGLLQDGAFYVANNEMMTSQQQLRNTILHEYGHNLGLTHSGPVKAEKSGPDHSYIPKYQSVMNYLYQFSHFDYSHTDMPSNNPDIGIPEACTNGSVACFKGSYNIAPDWEHMDYVNGQIGKIAGDTGVESEDPETSGHHHPDIDELIVLAAEDNIGLAGLRVLNGEGDRNIIIANRSDSAVTVELSNLGLDLHEFTLQVDYPGGSYRNSYNIEGVLSDESRIPVKVPITNTVGYDKASMPVQFRVYNARKEMVVNETIDFSVLNLTEDEAQKLMKILEANNSELLAEARNTVGKNDPAVPTLRPPTPLPTASNNPIVPPDRRPGSTSLNPAPTSTRSKPSVRPKPTATVTAPDADADADGSSSGSSGDGSSAGTIVGVLVALLTVLGLGAAAANYLGVL